MSTALQLYTASLKKLGVYQEGEALSAETSVDALFNLNLMLSGWNIQKYLVYGLEIEEFQLIPNQQSYTMGVGGDFDTNKPAYTDAIFLRYSNSNEKRVEIIDNRLWGSLQSKDAKSSIPYYAYIDINHPLRRVYLYPTPSEAKTIIFHNYRKLDDITNVNTVLSFPEGYELAIIYNLALLIAPEYGVTPSNDIYKTANTSLENIKRANIKPVTVPVDPALTGGRGFNWRIGE